MPLYTFIHSPFLNNNPDADEWFKYNEAVRNHLNESALHHPNNSNKVECIQQKQTQQMTM